MAMRVYCRVNRTFDEDDVLAELQGRGDWEDYGVRGSPRWLEIYDADLTGKIEVNGVMYVDEAALELAHPGLAEQIVDWALENGEWSE